MIPEEPTRLIRVSVELLDSLGSRTFDGRAITAEWGEPVGSCGVEPGLIFDIYEPTFTTTDDGYSLVPTADLDRLRAALNDENEIAHGEAVVERDDGVYPLGFCAYGDGEWPCRTQRGIDRALAALGDRAAEEGR